MALLSTQVLPDNTLEEFRIEFNKLVTDVTGLSLGNTFDTQIIFEGTTDDTFETALSVTDPTADRSIVFPDQSGNVILDSANISLADNIELQFGTGTDLKIFHDSNNSIIRDSGTGALFLEGSVVAIRNAASDETMAQFTQDGAAQLYHNNVAILATAATGISVAGDVVATDDLNLTSDAAVISFGTNSEVTLTHVHNDGLLLNTDMQLQFRDSAINIRSDADGDLDINADDEIELNSTLIDINGNVDISGVATHGDDIVSDTDSTDDLGTTSVRWANLFVDGITATDQITATGFTGTLDGILGSGAAAAASVTTLTATGTVTMTGKAINHAVHTEAAHATTSNIWSGGNTCLLSGSVVTFTDVADAPQAGAVRFVVANAAHIITDNAALEVDGNENYTCAVNDVLMFTAKTTSTFRVSVIAHGDNATGGGGGESGFVENNATISADVSIVSGNNAISAGPVTVANGVTLTIPNGSRYVIV